MKAATVFTIALIPLLSGMSCSSEDEPLPPPKNARHDKWRVLGMGGGGTTQIPLVSPHDSKTVVCACDMTGAYITHDGGATWRMFNLRTGVGAFAFDPLKPNVIYAGNVGLWRSEDNGDTWSLIWPDPKKTTEYWRDDHGEYILSSEDPLYPKSTDESIEAIGVDAKDSNHIAFAMLNQIYLSTDGAKTWKIIGAYKNARCIVPSGENNLIVDETGSRFLKNDATEKKMEIGDGRPIGKISAACGPSDFTTYMITPCKWNDDQLMGGLEVHNYFAGVCRGMLAIEFQGFIQNPAEENFPQFRSVGCGADKDKPYVVYVSFTGLRQGEGADELYNGIAKTTFDDKRLFKDTWEIVFKESTAPAANLEKSWIELRMVQNNPNLWFDTARGLAVAPTNPDIVYATDCFRAYRTTDGGKNWRQMNSFPVGDVKENRWTSRGLDVTNCYALHWDPFNKEHVFLTQTDMGLIQSSDGGESWQCASTGIPDHWRNTMYWMELDPKVPDLMWGACSYAHDLPREKIWRHQDTDNFEGGVCVSTDGGHNWKLSNEGMPLTACTHILLDPTSPVGARTLYACGFGRGVFKSTDNGKTWSLKNEGIEKQKPLAWRITRASGGTLYLTVARRAMKKPLGDPGDGALYKSTDGAEHWIKLALPEGTSFPMTVTVDPNDLKRLYLSMWGTFSMDGDSAGGAYVSTDGGQSWKHLFKDGPHTYELTIDPKNSKTLYVTGFNSSAWRSVDQGETWKRIKGFNFKYGHRVIVDPFHHDKIYITTFGGGLWYGPAEGDPDAVEDILTLLKRK